jgi:hypothetical protein
MTPITGERGTLVLQCWDYEDEEGRTRLKIAYGTAFDGVGGIVSTGTGGTHRFHLKLAYVGEDGIQLRLIKKGETT